MKTLTCSTPARPATRILAAACALLALATATGRAASDTDVYIIKAESVTIEEDKVTIVAEAKTSFVVLTGDHQPGYEGTTYTGRPSTRVKSVKSDKATFVIRQERQPDGKGGFIIHEHGWKMTLESAKALQAGEEVGRIGFYRPTVTIQKNQVTTIDGYGFLYRKRK